MEEDGGGYAPGSGDDSLNAKANFEFNRVVGIRRKGKRS